MLNIMWQMAARVITLLLTRCNAFCSEFGANAFSFQITSAIFKSNHIKWVYSVQHFMNKSVFMVFDCAAAT